MPNQIQQRMTETEYLTAERLAEWKSEYLNGAMLTMPAVSYRHSLINTNIISELLHRIGGRCAVLPGSMRLCVVATRMYTYPDVTVVSEPPKFLGDQEDILLNPRLIVEILSDATKNYDRGEKFYHYRRICSLHEYLMVTQDSVHVEQFVRQGDSWVLTETSDPAAVVKLTSVDCELPLAEIYADVEFEPPST